MNTYDMELADTIAAERAKKAGRNPRPVPRVPRRNPPRRLITNALKRTPEFRRIRKTLNPFSTTGDLDAYAALITRVVLQAKKSIGPAAPKEAC